MVLAKRPVRCCAKLMSTLLVRLSGWVLGHDPRMRIPLLRTLTAGAVYLVCVLLQGHSVWAGYVPLDDAALVCGYVLLGQALFYGVLRSGLTSAWRDPAMTMAQMIFALSALALAYRVNPHVRGALLIVVPLVLIFGAFTLRPSRCRALGWAAVGLFGAAMALGPLHEPQRIDPTIEWIHFFFVATVLPTISLLAGQLSKLREDLQVQRHELREALARLRQLATHDELTGLPNRHHVQDWVRSTQANTDHRTESTALALIDLDHFKRINDGLGHAVGDQVLRIFAREASTILRRRDILARWGGEEFLLVMPGTRPPEAQQALARLRARLALAEAWADCPAARATFSAGVALKAPSQSLEDAVRIADQALYAAKHGGRDRVVVAADPAGSDEAPVSLSQAR
jgi:diguanylate cyclase (GGDEF)-like protein